MSTNIIDSEKTAAAAPERQPARAKRTPKSAKSAKPAKKSRHATKDAKPKERPANKKSEVIDLMRRPGGATFRYTFGAESPSKSPFSMNFCGRWELEGLGNTLRKDGSAVPLESDSSAPQPAANPGSKFKFYDQELPRSRHSVGEATFFIGTAKTGTD